MRELEYRKLQACCDQLCILTVLLVFFLVFGFSTLLFPVNSEKL